MFKYFFAFLALLAPAAAMAANEVAVESQIFLEKTVPVAGGKTQTVLVVVKSGPPGSKLVFTTSWRNQSRMPIRGIVINSPSLSNVVFDGLLTGGEVSVDGAKSWGPLAALKVRRADGTLRPAQNTDVTNVRLVVPGAALPGASGKLSYRVIVK